MPSLGRTPSSGLKKMKRHSMLTSAPCLAYHRDEGVFILDTDASDHVIGAEQSQMQDGEA